MSRYEKQTHENWPSRATTWARKDLAGKHEEHCLCYECAEFYPNRDCNCPLAQANFEFCVENDMITPVWECPDFNPLEDENP